MLYAIKVTTSLVRALLLAGITASSFAATSCSANPGPAPTVSEDEIVISALQNGGYQHVNRANGSEAVASFGSCKLLVRFDPTEQEPMRVTGILLSEGGASYSLGEEYIPSAVMLATLPVAQKARCM